MVIDGGTAKTGVSYGLYEVGVEIAPNATTTLAYTIWMTPLDSADAVQIPSPTTAQDTVITTPKIPGLALHLPQGTTVVDHEGKVVTKLTVTAIPLDKPPFPLPVGGRVPIYFTIQPGGSEINLHTDSASGQGAQLYYPNTYHDAAGTAVSFLELRSEL
jgi:hypothetical protein